MMLKLLFGLSCRPEPGVAEAVAVESEETELRPRNHIGAVTSVSAIPALCGEDFCK